MAASSGWVARPFNKKTHLRPAKRGGSRHERYGKQQFVTCHGAGRGDHRFFRATEIDTRVVGMIGAIIAVWFIFEILTAVQLYLSEPALQRRPAWRLVPDAAQLWTLLVQTSSIAIMATGMVLIIVMRHIDLSVGGILTLVATIAAVLQVQYLGPALGVGHWSI